MSKSNQLVEQIVKSHVGTTWLSADTRWLTPAKTGYDFRSEKKTGMTSFRDYDFARL